MVFQLGGFGLVWSRVRVAILLGILHSFGLKSGLNFGEKKKQGQWNEKGDVEPSCTIHVGLIPFGLSPSDPDVLLHKYLIFLLCEGGICILQQRDWVRVGS